MRRSSVVYALILTAATFAAANARDGKAIYAERCAACHDSAIERTPPKAQLMGHTHEFIVQMLTEGLMRVQAQGLSAADIDAVAGYLVAEGKAAQLNTSTLADPDLQANRCLKPPPRFKIEAGDWNGWTPDLDNARFQRHAKLGARDVPKLKPKWVFAYPGGRVYGPPSVVGGRVFVGTVNGAVVSLDAKTGCTLWARKIGPYPIKTSVVVEEWKKTKATPQRFVAYFGDVDGHIFAVDAETGEAIWSIRVDEHRHAGVSASLILQDGRLYVPVMTMRETFAAMQADYSCCTGRGNVTVLDSRTGKMIWKGYTIREAPKPFKLNTAGTQMYGPSGASVWSPPTVDPKSGAVYATTGETQTDVVEDGSDAIMAFDLHTGVRRWSTQVTVNDIYVGGCESKPGPNCPKVNGPDVDFASPVIVHTLKNGKRVLLAGQKSGMVYGLDAEANGKLLWQTNLAKDARIPAGTFLFDRENPGIVFGMAADADKLYAAIADPSKKKGHIPLGVYALDPATGAVVWRAPGKPVPSCSWGEQGCTGAQRTAVTVIPGVVLAGAANGHLYGYDARDGKIVWDFDTAQTFKAVNGVEALGGSIESAATVVARDALYVMSGYASYGGGLGNALIVFTVDGK